MRIKWWLYALSCVISFIMGMVFVSMTNFWPTTVHHQDSSQDVATDDDAESSNAILPSRRVLLWELNFRRARPYNGITVPDYNGYSAKCIPDHTMNEMNVVYERRKLARHQMGRMDGRKHDVTPSEMQVGSFVWNNMKYNDDGRPIWNMEIWTHMQNQLNEGKDIGPPNYRNSGTSVSKAVEWVLQNRLQSCGISDDDGIGASVESVCHMSVFSAISPWAEAILYWSASSSTQSLTSMRKSSRRNVRITSVDFNPCILDDIPPDAIAECQSTLSLVDRPDTIFDLIVSYSGIEHDGLGRYGDPINPNGDISAMLEMWLLTRPGGILLLAVPCAGSNTQPQTALPIWGNKQIQVLQHRAYGAERYMRLLVGWNLDGFILNGKAVELEKSNGLSKMTKIATVIQCSLLEKEHQPLLILRKLDNMSFDDVLHEGKWKERTKFYEDEYVKMIKDRSNITCY